MANTSEIARDRELIMKHGGPTQVAKLLGFDLAKGGAQRVQNWLTRGIPARQKLAHWQLLSRDADNQN